MDNLVPPISPGLNGKIRLQGIAETMLIPLWAKAMETQSDNPLVSDPKSVAMLEQIDYDFSKFQRGRLTQVGVSVRTLLFDNFVRDFLARHESAVVVNLGAGLDTRRHRLAPGNARWYDVDLPEAMAWRRLFFSETHDCRFVEKSIFDFSWMEAIETGLPVMFIAEGLFMYFPEKLLRPLFQAMAARFPDAELYFEMLAPFMVGKSRKHDTVKMTTGIPEFLWGIKNSQDLNGWSPDIHFVNEWNYFDYHKKRWGLFGIVARLPFVRPSFASRIVQVRFGPGQGSARTA